MFGLNSKGSNDPQNKNSNKEKINLNEDNFQIEDLPIHTMRKDLAELKNPSKKKITVEPQPSIEKKSLFTQKQKPITPENNGPFFQKEKETFLNQKNTAVKTQKNEKYTQASIPKVARSSKDSFYFNKNIKSLKKNTASSLSPKIKAKQIEKPKESTGFFSFLKVTRKKEKELNEKISKIKEIDNQIQKALEKKRKLDSNINKEKIEIKENKKSLDLLHTEKEKIINETTNLKHSTKTLKESLSIAKQKMEDFNNKNNALQNETQVKEKELNEKISKIKEIDNQIQKALEKKRKLDSNINKEAISKPTTFPKVVSNVTKERKIIPPIQNQLNKKNTISKNNPENHSHGIGKAFVIAIVIFILLLTSVGGYYFWMTRVSSVPEEIVTTENNAIVINNTEPMVELSSQNSNYLTINLLNTDPQKTKKILDSYAKKVLATNIKGAFEFLITDENNTPITFNDFASAIGFNLSTDILSQIGPDFNFYIYNYGDKTRFGLSIPTENSVLLKSTLLENENKLIQEFGSLYLDIKYTLPLTIFAGATYASTPEAYIRYINITSSEDLSLDYAIFDNQLIVGTTKSTAYAILDKLAKQSSQLD